MNKLHIVSAAESEFAEALCWYAERSRQAAEKFDREFDAALTAISTAPRRYPFCDDRHRFYLMDRFPYQVIFREDVEEVVVIAVAHMKRRPRYWESR